MGWLCCYFFPISIHALREEGDTLQKAQDCQQEEFLSTPSARRATSCCKFLRPWICISIHALREEGDVRTMHRMQTKKTFLSTPSARRATQTDTTLETTLANFYPRPPRGGRPDTIRGKPYGLHGFLSTPSARRATELLGTTAALEPISIHALREEGDTLETTLTKTYRISIHALREEGDSKNRDKISIFKQIVQHSARI